MAETGAPDGEFGAGTGREGAVRRFRTLADAVEEGVYRLDPGGRFAAVNDAFVEATGYDRARLLDSHASLVFDEDAVERLERIAAPREDDRAEADAAFEAAVETAAGRSVRCELEVLDLVASPEERADSTEPGRGVLGLLRAPPESGPPPGDRERDRRLDQYEALTKAANDIIVTIDADSVVQSVNPAVEDVFGYEPEAVVGESLTKLMPEAYVDRHRAGVEQYLRTDERSFDWNYVELPGVRADGTEIALAVSFSEVEHGGERYFTGVIRDVTERKDRERDLELFRTLLDYSNDSVLVVDAESGRFIDVNETACERRGYAREELLDMTVPQVEAIFPDMEAWEAHVEELKEGGGLTVEGRHHRKDGSSYPVEVNTTYVELDQGYVFAIARDVTERRKRKQELERYETIVETIPDGTYVLDEDHRFAQVNDALVEMTGYDREELLGRDAELISTEGGHARGLELRRELKRGEIDVAVLEEEIQTARGDTFDAEIRFDALYDDGTFRGTAGVIRDISDRKEYERQLEQSNERLEQFAYAASHDLQEPLRMVTSYLQLLESRYDDELDEEGREFIEFAVDGAERMREMIDGLLAYSRVETRGDPFEPVDLEAVLEDVLQDLRLHIEESDADVDVGPLPTVEGDPSQLRQVFQNLLDNAIEYSGDEPAAVSVDAVRAGDEWVVSVSDDGIGIDAADQERVFEVFQRLHTQDEHEGMGIGLALCERIVERHGGDIWVESEPGEGATFAFTLPARPEDAVGL